jgi:succinoglycan biosynthesis transport protein ExoP
VILVVKWGETSKELIREILTADEVVKLRCSGAILNAVDMTRMRQYQECSHDGAELRWSGKIATMLGAFKWPPQS